MIILKNLLLTELWLWVNGTSSFVTKKRILTSKNGLLEKLSFIYLSYSHLGVDFYRNRICFFFFFFFKKIINFIGNVIINWNYRWSSILNRIYLFLFNFIFFLFSTIHIIPRFFSRYQIKFQVRLLEAGGVTQFPLDI